MSRRAIQNLRRSVRELREFRAGLGELVDEASQVAGEFGELVDEMRTARPTSGARVVNGPIPNARHVDADGFERVGPDVYARRYHG